MLAGEATEWAYQETTERQIALHTKLQKHTWPISSPTASYIESSLQPHLL
jgi:hypothetical protein